MFHILESERLILQILRKENAPQVLAFYEDNKSVFEPWEPSRANNFYTSSYQRASLTAEYHLMQEGQLLRYWIFLKEQPDKMIGTISFQNFLKGPYQSCTLGYKLDSNYQRMGYAKEGLQRAIAYLFDVKQIHRIEAYIMPNNIFFFLRCISFLK